MDKPAWDQATQPRLEMLMLHLKAMPPDFYLPEGREETSEILSETLPQQVGALVHDFLWDWQGYPPEDALIKRVQAACQNPGYGTLTAACIWLLTSPFFFQQNQLCPLFIRLLEAPLLELASVFAFPMNSERREELIRFVLRQFQMIPNGESKETSEMAWIQVSSSHRQMLWLKIQKKRERQRAIQAALTRARNLEQDA